MEEKFTFENLLSQLMRGADVSYQSKQKLRGSGYILGDRPPTLEPPDVEKKRSLTVVHASETVETLEDLRRFSASINGMVRILNAEVAAVIVELSIAIIDPPAKTAAAVPSVIIYVDQKFGGVRMWVAPKEGEHLVFRDLGNAHPSTSFLPHLIPAEAYGPAMAEA